MVFFTNANIIKDKEAEEMFLTKDQRDRTKGNPGDSKRFYLFSSVRS